MEHVNTDKFLEHQSKSGDDSLGFELDDEVDGFLEQFEAIPIELAEENCVNYNGKDVKKDHIEETITSRKSPVLRKEVTLETTKEDPAVLSDSLESGEYHSSDSEPCSSKNVCLERIKNSGIETNTEEDHNKWHLPFKYTEPSCSKSTKIEIKNEPLSVHNHEVSNLLLPGRVSVRRASYSSTSSSLSGKETVILPVKGNLPMTVLDEADNVSERKLITKKFPCSSPPLTFQGSLNVTPFPLVKDGTLFCKQEHTKQDMQSLDGKYSFINSHIGLDDIDDILKRSEKLKEYSKKRKGVSKFKNDDPVRSDHSVHSLFQKVNNKMEDLNETGTQRKKSPSASPISSSSSGKMDNRKEQLSLSSISSPAEEIWNFEIHSESTISYRIQKELKGPSTLSSMPANDTERNQIRASRRESKSRFIEKEIDKNQKSYSRSPVQQRSSSKSKSPSRKKSKNPKSYSRSPVWQRSRSKSPSRKKSFRRSIERYHSKSRSRSIERETLKKQRQSFRRSTKRQHSKSRSRSREKQTSKRIKSRSVEKKRDRIQKQSYSGSGSPEPRRRRSKSRSFEKRTVKRQRYLRNRSSSKSKSPGRRSSRSPVRRRSFSRSPVRRNSSRSPLRSRRPSSSMSISPISPNENDNIVTCNTADNDVLQAIQPNSKNLSAPQAQPIPRVIGCTVEPGMEQFNFTFNNSNNYYNSYYYNQEIPYSCAAGINTEYFMKGYQHPNYPMQAQDYWNTGTVMQGNYYNQFAYNQQVGYNQPAKAEATEIHPPLLPPLPTSEPIQPPPPPPPAETDDTITLTPGKVKPSPLISRLKSNLRYLLPEVTKKTPSADIVNFIDKSLQSPKRVTPPVSSSPSSVEEEGLKDSKKGVAENVILERLQEVSNESTRSVNLGHKPSSQSKVSELPHSQKTIASSSVSSKESHDSVSVETEIITSTASGEDVTTEKALGHSVVKPKSNSKYNSLVLKFPLREKSTQNAQFNISESDAWKPNMHRVIKNIPLQPPPPLSCSRSSLILINTSGTLPVAEPEQKYISCSQSTAYDNIPAEDVKDLLIMTDQKKVIEEIDTSSSNIKDDKSKVDVQKQIVKKLEETVPENTAVNVSTSDNNADTYSECKREITRIPQNVKMDTFVNGFKNNKPTAKKKTNSTKDSENIVKKIKSISENVVKKIKSKVSIKITKFASQNIKVVTSTSQIKNNNALEPAIDCKSEKNIANAVQKQELKEISEKNENKLIDPKLNTQTNEGYEIKCHSSSVSLPASSDKQVSINTENGICKATSLNESIKDTSQKIEIDALVTQVEEPVIKSESEKSIITTLPKQEMKFSEISENRLLNSTFKINNVEAKYGNKVKCHSYCSPLIARSDKQESDAGSNKYTTTPPSESIKALEAESQNEEIDSSVAQVEKAVIHCKSEKNFVTALQKQKIEEIPESSKNKLQLKVNNIKINTPNEVKCHFSSLLLPGMNLDYQDRGSIKEVFDKNSGAEKPNDLVPHTSQEKNNEIYKIKDEPKDDILRQDVAQLPVTKIQAAEKMGTDTTQVSETDNIIDAVSGPTKKIKQGTLFCPSELLNLEQAEKDITDTAVSSDQNLENNDKTSYVVSTLDLLGSEQDRVSRVDRLTKQKDVADTTQLKSMEHKKDCTLYSLVPKLPGTQDLTVVKIEGTSDANYQLSPLRHMAEPKDSSIMPVQQQFSTLSSLSTIQDLQLMCKTETHQKTVEQPNCSASGNERKCAQLKISEQINNLKLERRKSSEQVSTEIYKRTCFAGNITPESKSAVPHLNVHSTLRSNATNDKYDLCFHNKNMNCEEQPFLPEVVSDPPNINQMLMQTGILQCNNPTDGALKHSEAEVLDNLDVSEEKVNQLGIASTGAKESEDKIGESSKCKQCDMDYKQHRQQRVVQQDKSKQSISFRAASSKLEHMKEIWKDPKINMHVVVKLEKCSFLENLYQSTVGLADQDSRHCGTSGTEKQKQDVNASSKTYPSLPNDVPAAACTSKDTKDIPLAKSKNRDTDNNSPMITRFKGQVKKNMQRVTPKIQNSVNKTVISSDDKAIKDKTAMSSENKVIKEVSKEKQKNPTETRSHANDNGLKIAALEKAIALLTVPKRTISTQVRFKGQSLCGTHEVIEKRGTVKVNDAIITSLRDILHHYKKT